MLPRLLLTCGIVSSLLYGAMNVFVPMLFEGYSVASQTVSELSAIGAPTRSLWVSWGVVYSLLVIAFGCGVWKSAPSNRALRVVGALMIANGILSVYWPPMHLRGADFTLTDALHIVWAIATVILIVLAIAFGSGALGRRFRIYSIATLAIFLVFGLLTGLDAPRIAADLPTPLVGIWERVNIAAYMIWIVVLAVILLRTRQST